MRAVLVALVAANLLVLAWSFNWLPFFSLPREREPERVQRQVRPDAVQLITPSAASAALQAAAAQRTPGAAPARSPSNPARRCASKRARSPPPKWPPPSGRCAT